MGRPNPTGWVATAGGGPASGSKGQRPELCLHPARTMSTRIDKRPAATGSHCPAAGPRWRGLRAIVALGLCSFECRGVIHLSSVPRIALENFSCHGSSLGLPGDQCWHLSTDASLRHRRWLSCCRCFSRREPRQSPPAQEAACVLGNVRATFSSRVRWAAHVSRSVNGKFSLPSTRPAPPSISSRARSAWPA